MISLLLALASRVGSISPRQASPLLKAMRRGCGLHDCMLLLLLAVPVATAIAASREAPRLVLQITVDQLRGDTLLRYRDRLGTRGFRFLLDRGLYYANANYLTGNTFTASGHAVLVTGADTAEHGIVADEWFDRESGRTVYCTADTRHPIRGEPSNAERGMSPAQLASTTLGDEIALANSQSRAFALAGSDRGAIIPAGHLGKAFWFSDSTGRFVSSSYYYEALPDWVTAWNDRKLADGYRMTEWIPLSARVSAATSDIALNVHARPDATLGRTFPHPLRGQSDAAFLSALKATPFLDELTAAFARELIEQERLGARGATDYLSISFSAADHIGHAFGPNSLEAQDNLLRLDATLADLFAFIDRRIGLAHVIVVLSAGHGMGAIPEERRALGYSAQRLHPEKIRMQVNAAVRQRLGVTEDLVTAFVPPGFYLDRRKVVALGFDTFSVESTLAEELLDLPGIAYAFTRSDLMGGFIARTPVLERVQRGFHPTRSGDVVILQSQFWYLHSDAEAYAAMHGSPYSYDTYVPILLFMPGLKATTVYEQVSPAQIAPTLAALLGIEPPSGCACEALLPHVLE
jgi:predicted AlkP superfamily pyrophosphatase or phosphodiesterase